MHTMKCPKCGFQPIKQTDECPKCGIIFHKYLKLIKNSSSVVSFKSQTAENKIDKTAFIKELFFYIKPEANPLILGARVLFFIIMVIWGLRFILSPLDSGYAMDSFWHLVNLPFHEAGHLIFRPFGRFMTSLGGSLSAGRQPQPADHSTAVHVCIFTEDQRYLRRRFCPVVVRRKLYGSGTLY
jgi:hypothetical protein